MQIELFEAPVSTGAEAQKTCFVDPSFAANKALPVHRWVPWIAGFSSDFVRDVTAHEMEGKGTVLDPFAGVGTTLVEAAFMGHDVIGFEINPYAALACQVKLEAGRVDLDALLGEIGRLKRFCSKAAKQGRPPMSAPPEGFRTRRAFYSPKVLRKVLTLQDFIDTIEDVLVRRLFQTAFASTMVSYSNYSYEPSLGTRKAAGKADIEDANVAGAVTEKLREMAEDIRWVRANTQEAETKARVIRHSFFTCRDVIEPVVADLVITSPPYLNNYHYIRNTRPHLYWLGFAAKPKDTKLLERENFGKYWQTVREEERVELDFEGAPRSLVEQLAHLRALNTDRGIYGGNGWANYATAYFNDCYRFVQGLLHVLKPGASAYVVIGNSILQGVMIPTDVYLGQIAELAGFERIGIHHPRAERVGNSIIQSVVRVAKAKDAHRLYEAVVVLKKPC